MTDQERNQVLKMIADGRITPEEALKLMQVLDQSGPAEQLPPPSPAPSASENEATQTETPASRPDLETDPRIEQVKSTVRRLWQIPLWIGIAIIVLSAWGMYAVMQAAGLNFWFYFLLLPLLLGVLLTVMAVGSRQARWLFVDVKQKPGQRPKRIFLGFPLPLKFTAWLLRTFGPMIPNLQKTNIDEVTQLIETGLCGNEPLVVNVDDDGDGEGVRVYIG
jgi:hypothetical protein